MAKLAVLVAGLLLIAESQASDVAKADQGFLSQYMTAPTQRSWTSVIDNKPAFTPAKEQEKAAEKLLANGSNTPITLGAIGVGLLALVTMLGARMRRGLQPATALAGMEMQSQAQVPNIFYSGGDEAKLGAGGMADTRDPEPFVNETDKRQSISQAPSFEEYLKSRQFAADSREAEINHGRIGMLGLLGGSVFEKSRPFHSGASWPVKTDLVPREWDPLNLSGPSSGWQPTPAVFFNDAVTKAASETMAASKTALGSEKSPGGYMEQGTEMFQEQFPEFNSYGWGVSVKAERWNGRHAMFGWAFIIATGYCKAHGLIPDPDKMLTYKEWGSLARITGSQANFQGITNERACILVANIHFLVVSLCAAFAPLPFQDTLLLEPGEPDEEPAGVIPAFETGLTPSAELYNGRMAMLGLIIFSSYSMIYQIPFLDAVDNALGGLLLHPPDLAKATAAAVEAVADAPVA